VDPALLEALGLHVGDSVLLGDSALRIAALIAQEPDRGAGFMSFAPRVMINAADLPATALVQPASRVTYRLALAGPEPAVRRFTAWAEAELKQPGVRGVRLESLASGRPEMQQTLGRAEKFLNLVALLAALLSAVAVALAARALPPASSTPPPCCACWACRSAPWRVRMRSSFCWRGWRPAGSASAWAGAAPRVRRPAGGLVDAACPRPAPGPPWPAWAWA
jgi:hypothetical protein